MWPESVDRIALALSLTSGTPLTSAQRLLLAGEMQQLRRDARSGREAAKSAALAQKSAALAQKRAQDAQLMAEAAELESEARVLEAQALLAEVTAALVRAGLAPVLLEARAGEEAMTTLLRGLVAAAGKKWPQKPL